MSKTLSNIGKMVSKAPKPSPAMAADAFQSLQTAFFDYKKTVAVEQTKRLDISARRDVELGKIQAQKEILELYLKESFKERSKQIEGLFLALDKGIDCGNMEVVGAAMSSIVAIAKESPLAQATKAIADLRNPDVKSIDW